MIGKRTLYLVALLLATHVHADKVSTPDVDERARPIPDQPVNLSPYVPPMDPKHCVLGGRRFGLDLHPILHVCKMHQGWDIHASGDDPNPMLRSKISRLVVGSSRVRISVALVRVGDV